MSLSLIHDFTYVSAQGERVLEREFLPVWCVENQGVFDLVKYEWTVEKKVFSRSRDLVGLYLFPDSSGFICFERGYVPNNCTLLDAYGKERMRLTVPWHLTTANNPASNAPPTCFAGISSAYINPADGKQGEFGVKAWVEFAGEYYFELDWRTGQFLWGKEIRF